MRLFHQHHDDLSRPEDASFTVLGNDGVVRPYARQELDQIFSGADPEDVRRQVALGWVILDERQVETPGSGPSREDLTSGIEALCVGGVLGLGPGESLTSDVVAAIRRNDRVGTRCSPSPAHRVTGSCRAPHASLATLL